MDRLYKRLVESTRDGIYRYALEDGVVLLANQAFVDLLDLRCPVADVLGKRLTDLIVYTERQGLIRQALERYGELHGFEYHFRTLRGEDRWVLHDSVLAVDPDTGVRVVDAIVKDITDRKKAELALAAERERLMVTLRSIGDGVIATDTHGRVVLVNRVAERLTGWTQAEALGKLSTEVFRIVNEQTGLPSENPIEKVLQLGAVVGLANHTALISRDGTWRSIADSGAPVLDAMGNILGVVLVFRDITEERRAEERAAHRHAVLLAINRVLEESLVCENETDVARMCLEVAQALTASRFGLIAEVNPSGRLDTIALSDPGWEACRMPRSSAAVMLRDIELHGFWGDVVHSQHSVVVNEPHEYPHRTGTPPGHPSLLRYMGVPLKQGQQTFGMIALANKEHLYTADDCAAIESLSSAFVEALLRKRAEISLRCTMEELKRSNRELEHFATIASHDLQEPLRTITSNLELLERRYKNQLGSDADTCIHFAVDGAQRMYALINGLLTYSRVSSQARTFEPVNCEQVVATVLMDLDQAIRQVQADISVLSLPTIVADPVQLGQVFANLIGNALKFRGTDPPRIEIGAVQKDGAWLFWVSDNGIGIDRKYMDRVFKIFERLHPYTKHPGAGIGLAVCKKIIERHGGTIWFESEPGQGTRFFFQLPIRETESPRSETHSKEIPPTGKETRS